MLKTDSTSEINPADPTTGKRGPRLPRSTDTFTQRLRRFKRATGQSVPCPSVRNISRRPRPRREGNSLQNLQELEREPDQGGEIAAARRLLRETRCYDHLNDSALELRNRLQSSLNKKRLLSTLALARKEKLQAVKGYTISSNGILVVSENTQDYSAEGAAGPLPALSVQSVNFIGVEAGARYGSEKLLAGSKTCADTGSSDTGGPDVPRSGAGICSHRTQCVEGAVDQCVGSPAPGCGATGPGNRDDQPLKARTEQRGSPRMLQPSFTNEVSTSEPNKEHEVNTRRFLSCGLLDNAEFYQNIPGEYADEIYFCKYQEIAEELTDKDASGCKCDQISGVQSMFTEPESQNEEKLENFRQVTTQNKEVRKTGLCLNIPTSKMGHQKRLWEEIAGRDETDLPMEQSKPSFIFLEGPDLTVDSKQHGGVPQQHCPYKGRSLKSSPAGRDKNTTERDGGRISEELTEIRTLMENWQQQDCLSAGDIVRESIGEDRKAGHSSKFDLLATSSKSSSPTTCWSMISDKTICQPEDRQGSRTNLLCFDSDERIQMATKSATKLATFLPSEKNADIKMETTNKKTMTLETAMTFDSHQGAESPDRSMASNSILQCMNVIGVGVVNSDALNMTEARKVNTEVARYREEAITEATRKRVEDISNKEKVHGDDDTEETLMLTTIGIDVPRVCENDSLEITYIQKKEIVGATQMNKEENTDEKRKLGEDYYDVTQTPEEEKTEATQITHIEATRVFEEENLEGTEIYEDDTTGVTQFDEGFGTDAEQIQKEEYTETTQISEEGYTETPQVNAEETAEASQMHKLRHTTIQKEHNTGNTPGRKKQVTEDKICREHTFKTVGRQEENYGRIHINKGENEDDQTESSIEFGMRLDPIQIKLMDNVTLENESTLTETPYRDISFSTVHPSYKTGSKKDRDRAVRKKSEATEDLASQLVMYQSRKLAGMTEKTGPSPFRTFEAYHRELLDRVLQPSPCFSEVDCPVVGDDDGEEEEELDHHSDGENSEESYQGLESRENSFADKTAIEDPEINTNQPGVEVTGSTDVFGHKQLYAQQLQETNHIISHPLCVDASDKSEALEGLDGCFASPTGKNVTLGSRDQSPVRVYLHQSVDVTPRDNYPNVYLHQSVDVTPRDNYPNVYLHQSVDVTPRDNYPNVYRQGFTSTTHTPCFIQAEDITTTVRPYSDPAEYHCTDNVTNLDMNKIEIRNIKFTTKRKTKKNSHSRYNANVGSKIMGLSINAADGTDDNMTANPRLNGQSESALNEQSVEWEYDNEGTQSSNLEVISQQSDAARPAQDLQSYCKMTKSPSVNEEEAGACYTSPSTDVIKVIASHAQCRGFSEWENDGQRKLLVNDDRGKGITDEIRRMINFEKNIQDVDVTDQYFQESRGSSETKERVSPLSKQYAATVTYHDVLHHSVCLANELKLKGLDGTEQFQIHSSDVKQEESSKFVHNGIDVKQEESRKSLYNGIDGIHTHSPLLFSQPAESIPESILPDTFSASRSRSLSGSQAHKERPCPAESEMDIDLPDIQSLDFSTVANEVILGQGSVVGDDFGELGTIHQRLDRDMFSQVSTSRTKDDAHTAGTDLNQLHRLTCQRMMKKVLQRNGVKQTSQHSVKPIRASASYNEVEASASPKSAFEPSDVISSCVITGSKMTVQQRPRVTKCKETKSNRLLRSNRKLQKPASNVRSYHFNMSPPTNQTCITFPGTAEVVIRASRDYNGNRNERSRDSTYNHNVSRGYQERRCDNAGKSDARSDLKTPTPVAASCVVNTPQPPNNTPIFELPADPARANKNSNYSEPEQPETQTDVETAKEGVMPLYCYQPSPLFSLAEHPIRDMEHHPRTQNVECLNPQVDDIVANDITRMAHETQLESVAYDRSRNTTPSFDVIREGIASPRSSQLISYEDNSFMESRFNADPEFCHSQETEVLQVNDEFFPRDILEFPVGNIDQEMQHGVQHHEINKQNVAVEIMNRSRNIRPLAAGDDRRQVEDISSESKNGPHPVTFRSEESFIQTADRCASSDQFPTVPPANNVHEVINDGACTKICKEDLENEDARPQEHVASFTSSPRTRRSTSKKPHSNTSSGHTLVNVPVTHVVKCMKNSATEKSIPKYNDTFPENGDKADAAEPPTDAVSASNVTSRQLRPHRPSFRKMVREILSESDDFASDGDGSGPPQGSNKQKLGTMKDNVLGNNQHSNGDSELRKYTPTNVERHARKEDDSSDAESLDPRKGPTFNELKNRALAKAVPFLSRLQVQKGCNRSSTKGCGEERSPGLTRGVTETTESSQEIEVKNDVILQTNDGNLSQNSNKCFASKINDKPVRTSQTINTQRSFMSHNSPANVNANKTTFVSTRDHKQGHRRSRIPVRQPAESSGGIQKYKLQHKKGEALVNGEQRDANTLTLILKRKKGEKNDIVAALSLAKETRTAVGEEDIKMIRLSNKVGVYAKDNKVTVEVREDTSFSSAATTAVETSEGTTIPTSGKLPLSERIKKYQQSRPRNILAGKQRGTSSDPPIAKTAGRKASKTQAEWDSSCSDIPSISSSHLEHVSSPHHLNVQSCIENSNKAPQTPSPQAEIPITENKQGKDPSLERQTVSNKIKTPPHVTEVMACQSVAQQTSNKTSASLTSGLIATYHVAKTKKHARETSLKKNASPVEKSEEKTVIQQKLEKGVKIMSTFTKGKTWDVSSSEKHANANPTASNIPGAPNLLAQGPSATFVKKTKEPPTTRQPAREASQVPVKKQSEYPKDVGSLKKTYKVQLKNQQVPVKQNQFYKRLVRPQPSQAAVTPKIEPMIGQCELFSNSSPDQGSDGPQCRKYQDVCPLQKPETSRTGNPQKFATTPRDHLQDFPVFVEESRRTYRSPSSEADHGFGPDCLQVSFNHSKDPAENTNQRLVDTNSFLPVASLRTNSYLNTNATFLASKPPHKSTVRVPVVDQENNAVTHSFNESTDLETISAHPKKKDARNSVEHEFYEDETFTITDKPFPRTSNTSRGAIARSSLEEKPLNASHATVVLSPAREKSPTGRNTQSSVKIMPRSPHPPRDMEMAKRDKTSKKPTEKVVIDPIPAASSPQSATKHCKTKAYLYQPISLTTDGSNLDVKSNENSNANVCVKACRSLSHAPLVSSTDRDQITVSRSQLEEELDRAGSMSRGSVQKYQKSAEKSFRSRDKEQKYESRQAGGKLSTNFSNLSVHDSSAVNPSQPIADDVQRRQKVASLPMASNVIANNQESGCCNSSLKTLEGNIKSPIPIRDHTISNTNTKNVDSENNLRDVVTTSVQCEEDSLSLLPFQNHTDNTDSTADRTTPKSIRPRCVGMTTPRKGTITLTQLEQDDFEDYSSSLASSVDSVLSSSRPINESHEPQVSRSKDSVTPEEGSRLSGGAEHGEDTPSVTPSWKYVDSSCGSSDNGNRKNSLPPLSRRLAGRPHRAVYKRYY